MASGMQGGQLQHRHLCWHMPVLAPKPGAHPSKPACHPPSPLLLPAHHMQPPECGLVGKPCCKDPYHQWMDAAEPPAMCQVGLFRWFVVVPCTRRCIRTWPAAHTWPAVRT